MARKVYRSDPSTPDLSGAFTHAKELDYDNPQRHSVIGDPGLFASCGYATHDEASLLYRMATANRGPWLEIGAHTGWSTAHLALPGNPVVALEPEFGKAMYNRTGDASVFYHRFCDNLKAAGVRTLCPMSTRELTEFLETLVFNMAPQAAVFPHDRCSWDCLPTMTVRLNGRFAGIFVDGEHEPPFPLIDAMLAAPLLHPDSFCVFHDAIGSPVVAGVNWLAEHLRRLGRRVEVRRYMTPQFLTVVASGAAVDKLPSHTPDPDYAWESYAAQIDREVSESLATSFEQWRTYCSGWCRRPLSAW